MLKCLYCWSEEVSLYGKSRSGKQRYLCQNKACGHKAFQMEYKNNACRPGTKEKIVEMTMNGSGIRDTGRVLRISPNTVTAVLKNGKICQTSQRRLLERQGKDRVIDVEIRPILAEMDEMWGYYHDKSHQLWMWWAIDHETNVLLVYTFCTREHKCLDELVKLECPC